MSTLPFAGIITLLPGFFKRPPSHFTLCAIGALLWTLRTCPSRMPWQCGTNAQLGWSSLAGSFVPDIRSGWMAGLPPLSLTSQTNTFLTPLLVGLITQVSLLIGPLAKQWAWSLFTSTGLTGGGAPSNTI